MSHIIWRNNNGWKKLIVKKLWKCVSFPLVLNVVFIKMPVFNMPPTQLFFKAEANSYREIIESSRKQRDPNCTYPNSQNFKIKIQQTKNYATCQNPTKPPWSSILIVLVDNCVEWGQNLQKKQTPEKKKQLFNLYISKKQENLNVDLKT